MLPFAIPLFVMPRPGARASVRYGSRAVLVWGWRWLPLAICCSPGRRRCSVSAVRGGHGADRRRRGYADGETCRRCKDDPTGARGHGRWAQRHGAIYGILLAVALLGVVLSHAAVLDFTHRAHRWPCRSMLRRWYDGDRRRYPGGVAQRAVVSTPLATEIARHSVASGIAWLMLAAAMVAAVTGAVAWRLLPGGVPVGRVDMEPVVAD